MYDTIIMERFHQTPSDVQQRLEGKINAVLQENQVKPNGGRLANRQELLDLHRSNLLAAREERRNAVIMSRQDDRKAEKHMENAKDFEGKAGRIVDVLSSPFV